MSVSVGARMDGVDRDGLRSEITHEAAVEAGNRALGQRVERGGWKGGVTRHRRTLASFNKLLLAAS